MYYYDTYPDLVTITNFIIETFTSGKSNFVFDKQLEFQMKPVKKWDD